MRIKCQIKVINRDAVSKGMASGGKSSQATLFVAKKSDGIVHLVYCTMKDRNGVKYKLKDNLHKLFIKGVDNGKATIQLKTPPIDLFVSGAPPSMLKRLLYALRSASKGDSLVSLGILSSMMPATSKHLQRPLTNLIVSSRQDLIKSFPSTLEKLVVNECSLTCISDRILSLQCLTFLDLTSNGLSSLPNELAQMKLSSLILAHNELSVISEKLFCKDADLSLSLRTLDLSHNKLRYLPQNVWTLKQLWSLQVADNQIKFVPKSFSLLKNVRKFNASNNDLKFLPLSFLNMSCLVSVDVSGNPFDLECSKFHLQCCSELFKIPTLQELASRVIKKKGLLYHIDTVPYPLVWYLDNPAQCFCGVCCFEDCIYVLCSNTSKWFPDMRVSEPFQIPVQVGVCSPACYTNWSKHVNF